MPMNTAERQQLLASLAQTIQRRGLTTPAQVLLDLVAPVGILASQTAVFLQPFAPEGRWRQYSELFENSASWHELRALLVRD